MMNWSWLLLGLVTFLSSHSSLIQLQNDSQHHHTYLLLSSAFRLPYPSHLNTIRGKPNVFALQKLRSVTERKEFRIMMNDPQQVDVAKAPENRIRKQLQSDMYSAMKAKETIRLNAIRGIIGAIKQVEIDEKIIPDEARCVEIMSKMIRDRKESIKAYEEGGRADLVAEEQGEIDVISLYMPKQATPEEINQILEDVVIKVDAKSIKDTGKVMGELKKQLMGRVDLSQLGELVRKRLTGK